jgi:outer membrane protein
MKRLLIFIAIIISVFAQLALGETVNMDQFLIRVKEHSKDLQLAKKEKEMAKAHKRTAISTALPKIGAEAGYTRNLTSYYMYADFGDVGEMFGFGGGGPAKFKVNRNNEYSANVALQQTLFSPAVGSAIRAANQYEKLIDYVYSASQQAIVSGAKTMFYQTLLLEKVWQLSQSAEQNAKDNYNTMELKFDNGVVSEFELLQANVRWKDTIPKMASAKRNYEMALNNMKNWAGIPIIDNLILDGNFSNYPPFPQEIEFSNILQRRPDYNAMLWEEKLRKTNWSAKKKSFLPTLTGTAVYAYSAQSDKFDLRQENDLYFAGLNLSVPIFTGGYISSEIQKAQIEVEKSRLLIEQTKENIYNEFSNVFLKLKEAQQRIESAKAMLTVAEKAFQIAEITAKNGLATQLQLKDARASFDGAQINHYAAVFDYLASYYEWERISGQVSE